MSRLFVVLAMVGLLSVGCDTGTDPETDGGSDSGPGRTDADTDAGGGVSFTLTVVSPDGTVTSTPSGIDCGSTCSASFGDGTDVSLTAAASSGYRFVDWTEATCRGQGDTCSFTITADTTVTAEYEEVVVPVCGDAAPIPDPGGTNGFGRVPMINALSGGPTDIAFVPGSSDFIVSTQNGFLHYFNGGCDPQTSIDVEDIGLPVGSGGERGLLDIEFHPNWATNDLVFVYHTSNSDPVNSVSRLELTFSGGDMALANPVRVIDFIKTGTAGNHNGGGLVFAPDGTMLASVGDGGDSANGQTTTDLLGAVIRVSPVLTSSTAYDYTIPAGNMFDASNARCHDTSASSTDCPELLAIGLRNPYRMSIDGDIVYLGEVGSSYEEIDSFDYTDNTVNFGWRTHDGPADTPPFIDPILSYRRDQEPAITFRDEDPVCGSCTEGQASIMIGGVYHGFRYGGMLDDTLIWSEFFQGFVRGLGVTGTGAASGSGLHIVHLAGTGAYTIGPDEYVYFASLYDGIMYRLVRP